MTGLTPIYLILLGCLMGVLSGLCGIGGGIVVVPGLVLLLGLDAKMAIGTSLAVIVPVAISGLIKHRSAGHVDLQAAALIAVGGILTAWLGAWLADRLPADTLKRLFGAIVAVIGLYMALSPAKAKPAAPATVAAAAAEPAPAETVEK